MVVVSLDRHTADKLLDRLPAQEADGIRAQIMSLSTLESEEHDAAIHNFLHPVAPEVAFESSQSSELEQQDFQRKTAGFDSSGNVGDESSIKELSRVDNESIAMAIHHERISIMVALLVSLPRDRGAAVLRLLPQEKQTQIVAVMSTGVRANQEAVTAIADIICEQHAAMQTQPTPNDQHHDALQAILSELSPQERHTMLQGLEKENPVLAQRLARGSL